MTLGLEYSHLLEFERVELNFDGTGFVTRDLTGEYEYPEDRFVLTGDWAHGDLGLLCGRELHRQIRGSARCEFDTVLDFDDVATRKVDAFVTLSLQASYTGIEGLTLSLGVENALDEEVPFAIGDGDADLYGYVQNVHSPRGRFAYGKATYRF